MLSVIWPSRSRLYWAEEDNAPVKMAEIDTVFLSTVTGFNCVKRLGDVMKVRFIFQTN